MTCKPDETNSRTTTLKRYQKPTLTRGPVLSAVTAAKTVSGTPPQPPTD